jgi:hypothetical protein
MKSGYLEITQPGLSTKKTSYQQNQVKFNKTVVGFVNPTKFVNETKFFINHLIN